MNGRANFTAQTLGFYIRSVSSKAPMRLDTLWRTASTSREHHQSLFAADVQVAILDNRIRIMILCRTAPSSVPRSGQCNI